MYATPSNSESTWYGHGHSHNEASPSPVSNSTSCQHNPYPVDADSDTNGLASKIDNGDRGRIMVYWQTRSAVPSRAVSPGQLPYVMLDFSFNTPTAQVGAYSIRTGQVMTSGHQLISQNPGKALETKVSPDGRDQISDECCISCMILLVLLFSGTSPTHRITAVENEVERPVGTLMATIPSIHRPSLDPTTMLSHLLAQLQSKQALQRKRDDYKITFPAKQSRVPLVNLLGTGQILTKIEILKRRGWPKLKRLSRDVYRNSKRISRLRAHLSFLQAELEELTSRNGSSKAVVCKQEMTKNELSPRRICLIGSLLVQHYLEKCSEGPVDGNRVNIPGLTALLIDRFSSLRA
ncbi:hypothetical protein PCH_Pc09g00300 [Penicillium rubens Wisconsin 54-1255]|uniref:Uncharacterized protein n=1 Tax=Penicillium rubens (strain ATCC 28089 / DSM 1075 / NRRL 1951 / Wisconsin 54-1255) TaxID=500485 RepID=B6GWM5_PENRW|nr:hypothetical protein PCH_Pc09g00300 [Penicillium rubens Wisconsin 54-1255]